MKAHIVWLDPDGDKILDRLARLLAKGTGWTLSDRPRDDVQLNYFMLYIDYAQRFSDWHRTPVAAYFSHYEPNSAYKRKWWQDAAELIDIKTVTAQQYGEMLDGRVVKVTPPILRKVFNIKRRTKNTTPLIGVSGFIDNKSGRKGEALVQRLSSELKGAEVVASGQGWPVRKVNGSFDGMPDFYNKLDVFLCASTIEGIPAPPLEALSCGIPVVIPHGVGMLDELPDIDGIYRFEPGDYDEMETAVKRALKCKATRKSLRATTEPYTAEVWCKSHEKGLEKALAKKSKDKKATVAAPSIVKDGQRERAHHGNRGVYYVAYGDPARDCAKGAIESWRQHMPDVPVALASSEPLGYEDHFVNYPDADIGGRKAKVSLYDNVPADWQYVLYLDADTEITADVSFLFQVLEDGWDMVICKNPQRFHVARHMVRPDNKQECEETFKITGSDEVIQLNGGVFAFQKNPRTRLFFSAWLKEWMVHGKRDQAALLRALWAHPLKLYVLGNEWNTITRYDSENITAGILHYPMTARRWRGIVHERLDDPKAWSKVVK